MVDTSRKCVQATRNIEIAAYSGLLLRICLLVLLNYNQNNDVILHNYIGFFNVYVGVTIATILVLLIGIFQANHYYLIPYLVVIIVEIPLTSIALIFDVVFLVNNRKIKLILELMVPLIIIIWNYFITWLLINSYRQVELQYRLQSRVMQLSDNMPNTSTA